MTQSQLTPIVVHTIAPPMKEIYYTDIYIHYFDWNETLEFFFSKPHNTHTLPHHITEPLRVPCNNNNNNKNNGSP